MINRIFFQQNFLGKRFAFLFALACALSFTACGGDSGSSASDEEVLSSSDKLASSSSSVESSSSDKLASSSSSAKSSSSDKPASSSSSVESSSSAKLASSSSTVESSSSDKPASSSSSVESSSSDKLASSSSAKISSSSEYVPFDHTHQINKAELGDAYKTFTDERNGRSYYYMTFKSSLTGDSVTVMAENLNIGEMVPGAEDQTDDTKIERYCYNNDTTKCDEFGGLYQWAEMMQLPSRCNTESCSDLIQENHQGICPDGWRLFTYEDYLIVRRYDDEFGHGIEGLRSTWGFSGYNDSGFSLVGAGMREPDGSFDKLTNVAFWFYPVEHEYDKAIYGKGGYISGSNDYGPSEDDGDEKTFGFSVRCTKLKTEPVFRPE